MLPTINPTSTKAWKKLLAHAETMKTSHLRQLFQEDQDRSKKYSLCQEELVFDYSKNSITDKTIQLLLQLAEECKLK